MKEKGISTLVLVFIIATLLAMIVFVLHPISLLAARRANQLRYSQTAFFAAEGTMYETIQHLRDNENPGWPDFSGVDGEDVLNYTIGEADGETEIRRVITQTDEGIEIDITATTKGRKRRVVGTFARSTSGGLLPLDLMLVIDHSGSMGPDDLADAKEAARSLIDFLGSGSQVGFVFFNKEVSEQYTHQLSSDLEDVKDKMDSIGIVGGSNVLEGLYQGRLRLTSDGGRPLGESQRVTVFLTDGRAKNYESETTAPCFHNYEDIDFYIEYHITDGKDVNSSTYKDVADRILCEADKTVEDQITIFSIAFGSEGHIGKEIMEELANRTGGIYYHTDDSHDFAGIFGEIGDIITSGEFLELQEELPEPD